MHTTRLPELPIRVRGAGQQVPVLGGQHRSHINLDNAASTPPLEAVCSTVDRFMGWYSSVHRGAGFASQLASRALEEARAVVLRFVGADPGTHTGVFGYTSAADYAVVGAYPH